jgi:hypothetical protein
MELLQIVRPALNAGNSSFHSNAQDGFGQFNQPRFPGVCAIVSGKCPGQLFRNRRRWRFPARGRRENCCNRIAYSAVTDTRRGAAMCSCDSLLGFPKDRNYVACAASPKRAGAG